MKPNNPNQANFSTPRGVLEWATSVYKTMVQGIAFAAPTTKDASGAYNTFTGDNGYGVMVRIGATGDTSNTIVWPSSGPLALAHGLNRQPIGFIVCDAAGQTSVWQTEAPTTTTMNLYSSSPSVAVTVWIF